MAKFKLEYIWLDGYEPVPNLRGKTKIEDYDSFPRLEELPEWGFDGSSTRQADGSNSDCILKPVALFPDPARTNGALVMCEVMLPDGTPHPSNSRADIPDEVAVTVLIPNERRASAATPSTDRVQLLSNGTPSCTTPGVTSAAEGVNWSAPTMIAVASSRLALSKASVPAVVLASAVAPVSRLVVGSHAEFS
jgi:hypothetical protein